MIRHVVMFRWNDDMPDSHVEAVRAALAELPAAIPGILRYEFGADIGVNEGNFDFALTADFDDRDAYLAYRDHPTHQAFIAEMIAGKVAGRAAVQFEL